MLEQLFYPVVPDQAVDTVPDHRQSRWFVHHTLRLPVYYKVAAQRG